MSKKTEQKVKELVTKWMELYQENPEINIEVIKLFCLYEVNQELQKEFIDNILPLLTEHEEEDLKYEWDIMKNHDTTKK